MHGLAPLLIAASPISSDSVHRQALIYMAAAVICVPLAAKLRLGSVLGYLVAGALIGPFGLGFIRDADTTLHFAEFGVVLMLFVIGLELDPKRLSSMRNAVFWGGTLQFFTCGAALAVAGAGLGLPIAGAIIAGLALALSSTAVAMQTMRERNLLPTALGQRSFGILLYQDMAAIPLVALIPLLAEQSGAEESSFWLGALPIAVATAMIVGIGRYATRPLMRLIASTGMREVFTAFALLLVLGISSMMLLAGASMGLGAFLAGALLADSEYRHALEADIEPFKGLLMGLFFIAVGMSANLGLLREEPLLIAGVVVGFQAIKGGVLWTLAGPLRIDVRQRWLFAALLAQGGEFAFVVFGVARTANLLPGTWDARLTLAVALSMALTPLLLLVHDRVHTRRKDVPAEPIVPLEHAPVLIAGFGRFGQVVGRLLLASGIRATVVDHDPQQIDMLRKFGFRVYYGDATRIELLETARLGEAKLLINAIDDPAANVALVEAVRHHYPALPILSRARNVEHWFALKSHGVEMVERETFESALRLGRTALERLGVGAFEARERADRFRRHNVASLQAAWAHRDDEAQRIQLAKSAREQLERLLQQDIRALEEHHERDWHVQDPGKRTIRT